MQGAGRGLAPGWGPARIWPRLPPSLLGGTVGTCAGRSLLCRQGPVCPSSLRHARLLLSLVFTTLLAGSCLRFYEVAPPYTRWLGCCWAALWGLHPGKACAAWDCEEKAKGPSQGQGPSHRWGGDGGSAAVVPSPQEGRPGSPRPEPLEASRSEARPPHPETLISDARAFLVLS